ncbi:MAG: hypothetical protein VX733_04295 [Candidatus Latescibacterota bacterium]|nr:hypothetical protein [Candidatus Latescibacterota bacterium]
MATALMCLWEHSDSDMLSIGGIGHLRIGRLDQELESESPLALAIPVGKREMVAILKGK